MASTATLSSKYQISIPKAVRDEQQWEAGQEFVFILKGKGVLVMPVPDLDQLAGIAKGARKGAHLAKEHRERVARLALCERLADAHDG